ncbi:DUF5994 family protein [Nonomuraea sp. NPDC048916]|uniref:DUF5994 family protein n=1 Tax=Nonomuraea sp. NPDC048916 TaxID=3154232 RepID=UPI0033DC6AE7
MNAGGRVGAVRGVALLAVPVGPRRPVDHDDKSSHPAPDNSRRSRSTETPAEASAVRLPLGPARGHVGPVDGTWWPRSTDAAAELPALIAAVDQRLGEMALRVGLHVDVWDNIPHRIAAPGRAVRVGWFRSMNGGSSTGVIADPSIARDLSGFGRAGRRVDEARRCMGLDILAKTRMRVITGDRPQHNPIPQTLTA